MMTGRPMRWALGLFGGLALLQGCGGDRGPGPADGAASSGAGGIADGGAVDAHPAVDASILDGSSTDATAGDDRESHDGAAASDASSTTDAASPSDASPSDASSPADAGLLTDGGCPLLSASARAGQARSTGFSGTPAAYDGLYGVPCATASDCVPSCVDAGGTPASCTAGSLCLTDSCPDGGDGCLSCLPPTYWLEVDGALGTPGSGTSGNPADDNQADDNGYDDTLQLTAFGLSVPSGAVIRGIAFDVDRSADDQQATDDSVRVLQGGTPVGDDRASSSIWPSTFTTTRYGGPSDAWGASWTPADVAAAGFGLAITPQYLSTGGNDHVDVDSVSATVYYTLSCP